jgi:hypothetical protein
MNAWLTSRLKVDSIYEGHAREKNARALLADEPQERALLPGTCLPMSGCSKFLCTARTLAHRPVLSPGRGPLSNKMLAMHTFYKNFIYEDDIKIRKKKGEAISRTFNLGNTSEGRPNLVRLSL